MNHVNYEKSKIRLISKDVTKLISHLSNVNIITIEVKFVSDSIGWHELICVVKYRT